MSEFIRYTVACFFGGAVGFFIGAQFTPMFMWVGAIVGGAIGFLSYDLRKSLSFVPLVIKKSNAYVLSELKNEKRRETSPTLTNLSILSVLIMFVLLSWITNVGGLLHLPANEDMMRIPTLFVLGSFVVFFLLVFISIPFMGTWQNKEKGFIHPKDLLSFKNLEDPSSYWEFWKQFFGGMFLFAYVCLKTMLLNILPKTVLLLVKFVFYYAWKWLYLVGKHTFLFLFSRKSILAAFSSAVGAMIGLLFFREQMGIILGALGSGIIGSVVGVIGYYAISVPLGLMKN